MSLSRQDFQRAWMQQAEDTSPKVSEIAWRRYQHLHSADYETIPEKTEPPMPQFKQTLTPFVESPSVLPLVSSYKFITVPSNTKPWLATGIKLSAGGQVSTFATGRLWRSRLLDMFLPPQFALYFRVGVNGRVFNSTRDTNTFQVLQAGELYLAPQFPGQFANPKGGRVQDQLKAYDLAVHRGALQVLIVVWKDDVTHEQIVSALSGMIRKDHEQEWLGLIFMEVERLKDDYWTHRFPRGWQHLWFLGENEVYSMDEFDGHKGIRCCPDRNVGIIQKNFDPALPFGKDTSVSWDWNITSLPSRLREDTSLSHDYLSVAFEFENGIDITYTWSWELTKDHGYWCPLPSWESREFHIVIQTGPEKLGQWISEKRNLHADYTKHMGRFNVPSQIVRVWLIAGNRWQRLKGEMLVKDIVIGEVRVL